MEHGHLVFNTLRQSYGLIDLTSSATTKVFSIRFDVLTIMVEIHPKSLPVITIICYELMVSCFLWNKVGLEKSHVVIIPVNTNSYTTEIRITLEKHSQSTRLTRHNAFTILG